MEGLKKYFVELESYLAQYTFPDQPEGLYQPLTYFLQIGGKRLRPILTLLGADLFDGDLKKALPPATGIELFHNFTLIHDDIMDDAPLRRGKVTVHEKWDLNTAILSGDVLFVDAIAQVSKVDEEYLKEVLELFLKTAREVCEGQQYDMDFETINTVTEAEYIKMIQFKTSVLLGCALQIGAIVAGADKKDAALLYQFGLTLGTSFQIKDDLLDAFGDPEKFGKRVGGDIVANKKTILLLKALELANENEKQKLNTLIANTDVSFEEEKIAQVKSMFESTGARKYSEGQMEYYFDLALENLREINVSESKKAVLLDFAYWLKNRES